MFIFLTDYQKIYLNMENNFSFFPKQIYYLKISFESALEMSGLVGKVKFTFNLHES